MIESEISALQESGLDRDAPYLISGVSHGMLSVALHCGGCKAYGRDYIYLPVTDELIRSDVVKWLATHRKAQKKAQAVSKPDDMFPA